MTQQFDLDIWPFDLKINRKHLLWSTDDNCNKFGNFPARKSRDMSGQHLYLDQQFDYDLWPFDLKVNRELLLLDTTTVPNFASFEQKGQKIFSGQGEFPVNL